MMHDLAICGNLVLPTHEMMAGWIAITGSTISGIHPAGQRPTAKRYIDASGSWVMPGGIDAHVHSASSATKPEGFTRLTAAAALGGVTTVIDMPYDGTAPIWNVERLLEKVQAVEREAIIDVALFATLQPVEGWKDVIPLARAGACGFKLSTYETDAIRFPRIPDDQIMRIFQELKQVDLTVAFHAENGEIIDRLVADLYQRGVEAPEAHCVSRPPAAEMTEVAKLLEFARNFPVRLHIVHLTVPFGFDLLSWYRGHGVDATAETCTQYLLLDEGHLSTHRGFAKCNPPLRSATERELLWGKVLDGSVAFVTSDHVPWPEEVKRHANIFDNASGLPGVGQLIPLLYSAGVVDRGLPIGRFAQLVATNAARRYGLYPKKGALLVGSDADLFILDPDADSVVDATASPSMAKWSPYQGLRSSGAVRMTWSRGSLVQDQGRLIGEPGAGTFVWPGA